MAKQGFSDQISYFKRYFAASGLCVISILAIIGTYRSYIRGANDFRVFYEAWRLVVSGHGSEIYRVSPDRFLYGPGFAWLLSPLGLFPKTVSLGLWCLLKAFVLGFLIKKLSQMKNQHASFMTGISSWGAVLVARPLLIDFEYGQVNLLILGACIWGLFGHFDRNSSPILDFSRWIILTCAAITKLFPLPLLLLPWFVTSGISAKKIRIERVAIFVGFITYFLPSLMDLGVQETFHLLMSWKEALVARGLPLESHNQSFTALLYHYLSGDPTHVISEGMRPLQFGIKWLSQEQIGFLALAWTFISIGLILGWIFSAEEHAPVKWISILIGLLIVPSHLVWKPYFVMSLPLATLVVQRTFRDFDLKWILVTLFLFIGINLTGFDFVGHRLGAHFEAASIMLLMHLLLLGLVARARINS